MVNSDFAASLREVSTRKGPFPGYRCDIATFLFDLFEVTQMRQSLSAFFPLYSGVRRTFRKGVKLVFAWQCCRHCGIRLRIRRNIGR